MTNHRTAALGAATAVKSAIERAAIANLAMPYYLHTAAHVCYPSLSWLLLMKSEAKQQL